MELRSSTVWALSSLPPAGDLEIYLWSDPDVSGKHPRMPQAAVPKVSQVACRLGRMLLLCCSLTRRHQSIESLFDLAPDAGAIPRKVVGIVVAQCKEAFNTGTAVVWALHAQHRSREVLN